MRELVFALTFKGRGEAVPGAEGERRARSMATMESGETALLEAEVRRFPDGTFVETGRITYGGLGGVAFDTIGRGWVGPTPTPGAVAGGVLWRITRGEGGFDGAYGTITSNFTVDAGGNVVDNHWARIFLP
jgi:hypothetical protein